MTLCSHIPSPFHAPFSNECSFHAYLIVTRPSLLAASSLITLVPPFLSLRVTSGQIPPSLRYSLGTLISSLYSPVLRAVTFSTRIHPH